MTLPEKAFPVSWDQFHRDARALAWRISGVGNGWKAIVCITRGGLVPAAIISRELGIRVVETVCVASYHDYTTQGDIQVLKEVHADLLADDGEGINMVLLPKFLGILVFDQAHTGAMEAHEELGNTGTLEFLGPTPENSVAGQPRPTPRTRA